MVRWVDDVPPVIGSRVAEEIDIWFLDGDYVPFGDLGSIE